MDLLVLLRLVAWGKKIIKKCIENYFRLIEMRRKLIDTKYFFNEIFYDEKKANYGIMYYVYASR